MPRKTKARKRAGTLDGDGHQSVAPEGQVIETRASWQCDAKAHAGNGCKTDVNQPPGLTQARVQGHTWMSSLESEAQTLSQ